MSERFHESLKTNKDALALVSFNAYQKAIAARRLPGCKVSADCLDSCILICESSALDRFKRFARRLREGYASEYLRPPNFRETDIFLQKAGSLWSTGMLGTIDFCKWSWINRPNACHGQDKCKSKKLTITMEAIWDDCIYFWQAFFSVARWNDDITLLVLSPLLDKIAKKSILWHASTKSLWNIATSHNVKWTVCPPSTFAFYTSSWTHPMEMSRTFQRAKKGRQKMWSAAPYFFTTSFIFLSYPVDSKRKKHGNNYNACVILLTMVVSRNKLLFSIDGNSCE